MMIAITGPHMRMTTTATNKRNTVRTGHPSQCTRNLGTLRGSSLNMRMRLDMTSLITTRDDRDTIQSILETSNTNTNTTSTSNTTNSRTTPTTTTDHTAVGWSTTKRTRPTQPISPSVRHTNTQTASSTELRRSESCPSLKI